LILLIIVESSVFIDDLTLIFDLRVSDKHRDGYLLKNAN